MERQLRDTALGGGSGARPQQPAPIGGAGGTGAFLRAYDDSASAPVPGEGRGSGAPHRRAGDGGRHLANDLATRRQDEAFKHARRREAESPSDISAYVPEPAPLAKPLRGPAGDDDAAPVAEGCLRGGTDAGGHEDRPCAALGQGTPEGGAVAASHTIDAPDGGATPAGGSSVEEIDAELHGSQKVTDLLKVTPPPGVAALGDEIDVAAELEAEGRATAKGASPFSEGEDPALEALDPGGADNEDPAEPSVTAGMAKAGLVGRPGPGISFEARRNGQRPTPARTEQMGTEPMALPSPAPLATALIPAAFASGAGTFGDPRRDLSGAASRVAEQLAAAVAVRPEGVDVTLRPEELGHVRISIDRRGAEVAVTVVADRGETVELMRRHADLLAAEFRAAGFGNCSFHFGQQRGRQATGRGGETVSDSKAEGVAGPPSSLSVAIEAAATQAGAGLDLRV